MTEEAEIQRKAIRRQLKKTLEAYKSPQKISPKLQDSIRETIATSNAETKSMYEQYAKEFLKREQLIQDQLEAIRRGKTTGRVSVPAPGKRQITLEDT